MLSRKQTVLQTVHTLCSRPRWPCGCPPRRGCIRALLRRKYFCVATLPLKWNFLVHSRDILVLRSYTYTSLLQENQELCWQSLLSQTNLRGSRENCVRLHVCSPGCQVMLETPLYPHTPLRMPLGRLPASPLHSGTSQAPAAAPGAGPRAMFDRNLSFHPQWSQAALGAFLRLPYGDSPLVNPWPVFHGYLH